MTSVCTRRGRRVRPVVSLQKPEPGPPPGRVTSPDAPRTTSPVKSEGHFAPESLKEQTHGSQQEPLNILPFVCVGLSHRAPLRPSKCSSSPWQSSASVPRAGTAPLISPTRGSRLSESSQLQPQASLLFTSFPLSISLFLSTKSQKTNRKKNSWCREWAYESVKR